MDSLENVQKRLEIICDEARGGTFAKAQAGAAVQSCRIWIEAEKLKVAVHRLKAAEEINKRLAAENKRLKADLARRGLRVTA